jgi:parallel beta-helix repeat protein
VVALFPRFLLPAWPFCASRNAGPDSGVGIVLFESHNSGITDNTLSDNAELGIHLIQSDHNYVGNNEVRRNPEDGIILEATATRSWATAWCETASGSPSSRTTDGAVAMWCVATVCAEPPAPGYTSTGCLSAP